jgi:hypothetical protein
MEEPAVDPGSTYLSNCSLMVRRFLCAVFVGPDQLDRFSGAGFKTNPRNAFVSMSATFSLALVVGLLVLAAVLALSALRKSALASYYAGVYPLARLPPLPCWLSSGSRFLYAEAQQLPAVAELTGPPNAFSRSPAVGQWWVPVWFPPGARIRNEYPPDAWWTALSGLRRELRDRRGFLEVSHVPDDLQRVYRIHGTWFYATPGSGVFLETGPALAANNKLDALSRLGMSWKAMGRQFARESYMYAPGKSAGFSDLASGRVNSRVLFAGKTDEERSAALFEFATSIGTPSGIAEAKKRGWDSNALYDIDRAQNSAVFDAALTALGRARGYDALHFLCQANGNGGWAHEIVFVKVSPTLASHSSVDEQNLAHLADRLWIADPMDNSRRERCRFFDNDDYACLACLQQTSNASCRLPINPSPPSYA